MRRETSGLTGSRVVSPCCTARHAVKLNPRDRARDGGGSREQHPSCNRVVKIKTRLAPENFVEENEKGRGEEERGRCLIGVELWFGEEKISFKFY